MRIFVGRSDLGLVSDRSESTHRLMVGRGRPPSERRVATRRKTVARTRSPSGGFQSHGCGICGLTATVAIGLEAAILINPASGRGGMFSRDWIASIMFCSDALSCWCSAGLVTLDLTASGLCILGRAVGCGTSVSIISFFPRVRTPRGHGAQVIIEGREIQSDGGEKDKDSPTTKNNRQPQPKGRVSTIL